MYFFLPLLVLIWFCDSLVSAATGNTVCVGPDLDWYTNAVGETPCRTYERLRQICNSAYTVGTLSTETPGDRCDDQLATCCANSISFALSMLCLNCQQDNNSQNGYDAGVGAYQLYLSTTSTAPTNQSLPSSIQTATCNEDIKIFEPLYTLFWGNGAWFYTYTREATESYYAANEANSFECSASISSTSTTTSATKATVVTSPTISTTTTTTTGTSSISSTGTNSAQPTGNSTSSSTASTGTGVGAGSLSSSTSITSFNTIVGETAGSQSTVSVANDTSANSQSMSPGAIGGLAAGIVLFLLFTTLIGVCLLKRRRNRQEIESQPFEYYRPPPSAQHLAPGVFRSPSEAGSHYPVAPSSHVGSSEAGGEDGLYYLGASASMSEVSGPGPGYAPMGPANPSFLATAPMQDQDAGPISARFPSGRLPPPYNRAWDVDSDSQSHSNNSNSNSNANSNSTNSNSNSNSQSRSEKAGRV